MNWVKIASRTGAAAAAGVAGFASYQHIVKVAHGFGESFEVAAVLPLSIDGLIVVGTMAMIEDKRAGRRPRLSARVALGFGVVATLASNIASAQPSLGARLMAAVPAISFLIAVEVLARTGKRVVDKPADITEDIPAGADATPGQSDIDYEGLDMPGELPGGVASGVRLSSDQAATVARSLVAANPDMTPDIIAPLVGRSERQVKRYLDQGAVTRINGHAVSDLVPSEGK